MQDHDRGSYRDQRRRAAKQAAEAYKEGKADEMFFGASPSERKDLRKTKDKRGIDVDALNLAPLDRGKFNAPEKVGENLRLIDMAMGNEPNAPKQPGVHPAAPKKQAQPRPKKKAKKRRPKSSARNLMDSVSARMPSWIRRQAREHADGAADPKSGRSGAREHRFKPAPAGDDEGVVVAKPRGRGLERLLWLAGLGCLGAGAAGALPAFFLPEAAVAFPGGWAGYAASQQGLLAIGAICAWLALDLRLLRHPRGWFGAEALRCIVLAGLPSALAAALVHVAGLTPDPGLAPPGLISALAPLEPHVAGLGLPLAAGAAAPVFALAFLAALIARARAPKL